MSIEIPLKNTGQEGSAVRLARRIQEAGYRAYWAGGCVRDRLMDRTPVDYDIATDARVAALSALFPSAIPVGRAFGVLRIPFEGFFFEVAMFRTESQYSDGRHPDNVSPSDPEADAKRRDFTVNAIFFDPVAGLLHDYVNGVSDVKRGLLRCVGDASERFREDHLRMLRAVRFKSTLGLEMDRHTADAIRANAPAIEAISPERIRDELIRILVESPSAGQAILLMDNLGLLNHLLPEILATKGVTQQADEHPEGDVFMHTVKALDIMDTDDHVLALAVLLHDAGKPSTRQEKGSRITFPGHSAAGATIAEDLLTRLRFSRKCVSAVVECIRRHNDLFCIRSMTEAARRRFMAAPGFSTELELHRIDVFASTGSLDIYEFMLARSAESGQSTILPPRWIDGNDVLAMGVERGPEIRRWLEESYDEQLERRCASREELLQWLRSRLETTEHE